MKKLLILIISALFALCLFFSLAHATTWYVDATYGNDGWSGTSLGYPREHISAVLDDGSFADNDTVILRNNDYFADEGTYSEEICHYFVENDNITFTKYSSDASKPRIIAYEQAGDTLRRVFVVEGTDITFDKIKFNAAHPVSGVEAELHIGIWLQHTADGATISECEFRNFGFESGSDPEPQFQGIIEVDGRTAINYSPFEDFSIENCYFINNPFATHHGHELYLRTTRNATIAGNTIHAGNDGDPIKLRDDCQGTVINNNIVYVGYASFIEDYPNSGEKESSDTEIYDNVFYLNDDSTSVNTDLDIYKGPFWNPNRYPFISECYDNTFNCEFSGDDGNYIYGVACEDTCTYVAVHHPQDGSDRTYIYRFPEAEGPIFQICKDQTHYDTFIRGDMCMTDDYVIVCGIRYLTASTDSVIVYRINKDGSAYNGTGGTAKWIDAAVDNSGSHRITSLCSYNGSYFITAITESDSVRIYRSTDSEGGLKNKWLWSAPRAEVDSVTAMTYNYEYNRFLFATQEGSSARIYLGSIQNPDSTTVYGPTANRHIQALSLGSSNYLIVSALKNTSNNYLYLYYGTYTNPISTQTFSIYNRECNGLAGYGTYRYTSLNGSSYNRKLYWGSYANPLYQILYYSQWWSDYYVE